jgi:hypothetical protein
MTVKKPDDPPLGRIPTGGMEGYARFIDDADLSAVRQVEKEKAAEEAAKEATKEATPDDEAIGKLHAALMRAKRVRPEILEAVIAVRGHNNPADHPYSVAGSLLAKVNAWLEKYGYKPVLVDALARRIPHT